MKSVSNYYELIVDEIVPEELTRSVAEFLEWSTTVLHAKCRKIVVVVATGRMRSVGDENCVSLNRIPRDENVAATIHIYVEETFLSGNERSKEERVADVLDDLARNLLQVRSYCSGLDWDGRFIKTNARMLVLMYLDELKGSLFSGSSMKMTSYAVLSNDVKIACLIDLNCSFAARKLLREQSKYDHIWSVRMAETYQIDKAYGRADILYQKALLESPRCPFALWNYASCLSESNRPADALDVLHRLSILTLQEIAYGKCGEGMRRAQKLKNDSRYLEASCLYKSDNIEKARRIFRGFLNYRRKRIGSVYSQKEIKRFATLLEESRQSPCN